MLAILTLTACSNTPTAPSSAAVAVTPDETTINKIPKAETGPPMTLQKAGKTMKLVRIMEGGACKNAQQGAKGVFLLYADAEDIQRIKARQGAKVFAEFEKSITDFSVAALKTAVNKMNYTAVNTPPSPGAIEQNLIRQFDPLFEEAIAPSIAEFQKKSTLTIAVQPFASELVFYNKGCEATKEVEENEQTTPGQSI